MLSGFSRQLPVEPAMLPLAATPGAMTQAEFTPIPACRTATPIGSGICGAEKLPMDRMEPAGRRGRV